MHLGSLAIWNLTRRPLRSLLTLWGIAMAVGCFVAMIGLSRGLEKAWINSLMARGTHLLAMQKGAVEFFTTSLEARLGEGIRRIEGVGEVAGELADMMTLEGSHLTIAVGWTPGSYLWRTLRLVEGRMPSAGEEDVILLGQSVAEALLKKPGDFIRLREKAFRIIGLFRIGGVVGNNLAILPLPVLQAMMGRRDKVTVFHIRVDRPQEPGKMASVRMRLQRAFLNLSFVETSQVADNDMIVKLFRAIAWSISLIAIVIALVVVLNTLLMAVIERTREIGILSALGWPTGRIVGIIVLEGLVLAFLGGAAGLGIGVAGLTWLTGLPVLRGIIEIEISGRLLIEILGSVVLLGGLGSLYPAWRAAHLNPVEALRNE